jgi:hypothetical protein
VARIRTIKPGFFASEDVSCLTIRARLTWIGLWTYADDLGRAKDNTRLIKAALYPLDDVTLRGIDDDLAELAQHGRIRRYEVDGSAYLEVVAFDEHQRINRPTPSKIPPPPEAIVSDHPQLTEPSLSPHARKGREGKGREATRNASARPAPRCEKHLTNPTDDPCRACGQARRAFEAWTPTAQSYPTASEALNPELCDEHGGVAGACALCRAGVGA